MPCDPVTPIVVYTLDRLGRNLREMLNMIHDLTEQGIKIRSLADPFPVDTSRNDARAEISTHFLGFLAQVERAFANERAAHARAVRRANGVRVGRKRAHSDNDIEHARLLRADDASYKTISEKTGIPVASVHRYLTTSSGGDSQHRPHHGDTPSTGNT